MARVEVVSKKRIISFETIKSPHFITTIDHGPFSACTLPDECRNGFLPFLNDLFGPNQGVISILPQHGKKIILVNRKTEITSTPGDGLCYTHFLGDNHSGKILAGTTGNCPYLLIEGQVNQQKIVVLAHSGWQGTLNNIAGKSIAILTKNAQIPINKIHVGLWPGICPDCYEVGDDVFSSFNKKSNWTANFFHYNSAKSEPEKDRWDLDIAGIITNQLLGVGLTKNQIEVAPFCSCCTLDLRKNSLFYSLRGRQETARNAIFLMA